MLCSYCDKIVLDRSLIVDDQIAIQYDRHDEFPACPALRASASAGCQFCDLLLQTLWLEMKARPVSGDAASLRIHNVGFWITVFDLIPGRGATSIALLQMDLSFDTKECRGLSFMASAEEGEAYIFSPLFAMAYEIKGSLPRHWGLSSVGNQLCIRLQSHVQI